MSNYKLGKKPAVRPHGLADLAAYSKGKLPKPPVQIEAPIVSNWTVLANDTLGDCTIAGAAHLVMAWNVEVNVADAVPTVEQVKDTYFALSGGEDSGLVERTVLAHWYKTGLFGNRIAGFAPVATNNITALHQAIAFYGGAYIGVQLPASAERQFATNDSWHITSNDEIVGGHCIVIVGYDDWLVYAVTWGKVVEITYPWLHRYMDEAWAILPHEFETVKHGREGIDLDALQADLKNI